MTSLAPHLRPHVRKQPQRVPHPQRPLPRLRMGPQTSGPSMAQLELGAPTQLDQPAKRAVLKDGGAWAQAGQP